jgi:hypothetical protein
MGRMIRTLRIADSAMISFTKRFMFAVKSKEAVTLTCFHCCSSQVYFTSVPTSPRSCRSEVNR